MNTWLCLILYLKIVCFVECLSNVGVENGSGNSPPSFGTNNNERSNSSIVNLQQINQPIETVQNENVNPVETTIGVQTTPSGLGTPQTEYSTAKKSEVSKDHSMAIAGDAIGSLKSIESTTRVQTTMSSGLGISQTKNSTAKKSEVVKDHSMPIAEDANGSLKSIESTTRVQTTMSSGLGISQTKYSTTKKSEVSKDHSMDIAEDANGDVKSIDTASSKVQTTLSSGLGTSQTKYSIQKNSSLDLKHVTKQPMLQTPDKVETRKVNVSLSQLTNEITTIKPSSSFISSDRMPVYIQNTKIKGSTSPSVKQSTSRIDNMKTLPMKSHTTYHQYQTTTIKAKEDFVDNDYILQWDKDDIMDPSNDHDDDDYDGHDDWGDKENDWNDNVNLNVDGDNKDQDMKDDYKDSSNNDINNAGMNDDMENERKYDKEDDDDDDDFNENDFNSVADKTGDFWDEPTFYKHPLIKDKFVTKNIIHPYSDETSFMGFYSWVLFVTILLVILFVLFTQHKPRCGMFFGHRRHHSPSVSAEEGKSLMKNMYA